MKISNLTIGDYKKWLIKSCSLILGLIILPNFYAQAATCPEGYTSASFLASDYTQFGNILGGTSSPNRPVMGGSNNLTVSITGNGNSQSIQGIPDTGTGFQINQVMPNGSAVNTTTFKFDKPLSGLKVNIFDIDRVHVGASFGDKVTITAKSPSGTTINPTTLTYNGSYYTINANTIETGTSSAFFQTDNCSNTAVTISNECLGIATFNQLIQEINIDFVDNKNERNKQNILAQFQGLTDSSMCVQKDNAFTLIKSNGVDSVNSEQQTAYTVTLKNIGAKDLTNIVLKDPASSGLEKLTNITCNASLTSNTCTTTSTPTVAQLESTSGYTLSTLKAGQSYSIVIPAFVTANTGTITNTATAFHSLAGTLNVSDTDAVNSIFAPPSGGSVTPASCPAGHQMYYVGSTPPAGAISRSLNWPNDGATSNTFTFSDGRTLTINFPYIKPNSLYILPSNGKVSPYYGSYVNGVNQQITNNAINIF
ncbi:MAG: hypothetical protein Q4P13_02980 [Psychrobacter sp.]|nr:hypothetical protein [Psychrobacter sp.]